MRHGELVGGRYRLDQRLGSGGMGEVWSGFDEQLRRRVAVKVLLTGPDADPQLMDRLRQEAQAAAALHHPGITAVYDMGEHEERPFFVMELLGGRSLADELRDHPAGLPVAQAVDLMAQTAEALGHAHAAGVIHRDIKPANLMLTGDGSVKICDFGISHYAEATAHLTQSGAVMGTPAYMAPEQYEGKPADARTDLYALGVTLHALLTGKTPFDGPSPAAFMRQHLLDPAPHARESRRDLPPHLDDLLQRLLAKDPGNRPATAAEVRGALQPDESSPATRTLTTPPGGSRKRPPRPLDPASGVISASTFVFLALVSITIMTAANANIFNQAGNKLLSDGVHENLGPSGYFYIWITYQLQHNGSVNGAFWAVLSFLLVAAFVGLEISLHKLADSAAGKYLRYQPHAWVARLVGLALLALIVICYQQVSQPCLDPANTAISPGCSSDQVFLAAGVARNLSYACACIAAVEILVVIDLAVRAGRAVAKARPAAQDPGC